MNDLDLIFLFFLFYFFFYKDDSQMKIKKLNNSDYKIYTAKIPYFQRVRYVYSLHERNAYTRRDSPVGKEC